MKAVFTLLIGAPLMIIFFVFIFALAILKFETGKPHLKDL